jgi:hypothetical protein
MTHPLHRRSGRLDARRGANDRRAMTAPQPAEARAFVESRAFAGPHPDPMSPRHREIVESVLARRLSTVEIEAIDVLLRLRAWDRPDQPAAPAATNPRPARPSVLDLGDD